MLATDMDSRATDTVKKFAHVRLATASAQWFIAQDQLLVSYDTRGRNEEPLSLSYERVSLATVTLHPVSFLAALKVANELRLESFLCSDDAADGSTLRDTGDKPVPLVVPAKELILGVG